MSSIMASVGQDSELKFAGQDGYVRYTFGADGKTTIDANQFSIRFTLSMQGLAFEIAVTIDGTASADYAVDSGKMTFSNVSGDDLKLSATLNDTDLFEGQSTNQLESLFGLSSAGPSTFAYQCDGNAMTYTPPIGNADPVILKRVAP
jgi:hypothetical protein